MAHLFSPLPLRGVILRNRIGVSPMCQYSSVGGMASDWHLVHLGALARGGAGLVVVESTAVAPEGRISPDDLGIWSDAHIGPLARIAGFVTEQGAVPAIQIGHAGRKASMPSPWKRGHWVPPERGGWPVVGPGTEPFAPGYGVPRPLTDAEVAAVPDAFAAAARRALLAGFQVIELHAAHGYLLHQFLSPQTNRRTDRWGGPLAHRARLLLDVARAVRAEIGDDVPLMTRLTGTDWVPGGITPDEAVAVAHLLRDAGVDLVDTSTGGNVPDARIPVGPGYQVPFAERIRREAGVATAAVGEITDPHQADALIREDRCDVVMLARTVLRNPSWPQAAARALGVRPAYPPQYAWALDITSDGLAAGTAAGTGAGGDNSSSLEPEVSR